KEIQSKESHEQQPKSSESQNGQASQGAQEGRSSESRGAEMGVGTPARDGKTAGRQPEGQQAAQVSDEDKPHEDWPQTARDRVAKLTAKKNTLATQLSELTRERDDYKERLEKNPPVQA